MQVGYLVTNGGPHPADKWADMTTETILGLVQVAEDSVTPEAMAARAAKRDLRPKLFAIFMEHHGGVQTAERDNVPKSLKAAAEHVEKPLEPEINDTAKQVFDLLATTPFAAHFAKLEVRTVIETIIGQHTADVMHIERRWHHDRHVAGKGA